MRIAVSGKLFDGGVQGVHSQSIADGRPSRLGGLKWRAIGSTVAQREYATKAGKMSKSEHDLVDFEWLVSERGRIQELSLRLLSLMKSRQATIFAHAVYMEAVLLMIGAAFSLWRAVFLAHSNQTTGINFEAGQQLIEKVVRHNMISYFDDVALQTWSFGFYLNNCRFRLQQMPSSLDLGISSLSWLNATLPIDSPAQLEWTKHFEALEEAFNALKSRILDFSFGDANV